MSVENHKKLSAFHILNLGHGVTVEDATGFQNLKQGTENVTGIGSSPESCAAINSGRNVTNDASAAQLDGSLSMVRSAIEAEQNLLSIYTGLKDYKSAQRSFAATMVSKEITADGKTPTLFQSIWASLAFVDDSLDEQEKRNARIQGYVALNGDYEAQHRYAKLMQAELEYDQSVVVAAGYFGSGSSSGDCSVVILGQPVYFAHVISGYPYVDYASGDAVIVIYTPCKDSNTPSNPHKLCYIGKTDAMIVGWYKAPSSSLEIEMWKAAGADLQYVAQVAPDPKRTTDVSRNYGEQTLQERFQKYIALGQDYLGKMELAQKYMSWINNSSDAEYRIWESLQGDSAILLKLRATQAAQQTQRE